MDDPKIELGLRGRIAALEAAIYSLILAYGNAEMSEELEGYLDILTDGVELGTYPAEWLEDFHNVVGNVRDYAKIVRGEDISVEHPESSP